MERAGRTRDPAVGLCSTCRHGRAQPSAGGSRFWRCRRGGREPGYLKYPPLPVQRCPGFEEAGEAAVP